MYLGSYNTHYGATMDAMKLKGWAINAAKDCIAVHKKTDKRPVFCYRGMSGIAAATAVALKLPRSVPYSMIYVRKEDEAKDSHGSKVETYHSDNAWGSDKNNPDKFQLLFVDDFIDSGNTFLQVVKSMRINLSDEIRARDFKFLFSTDSQPDKVIDLFEGDNRKSDEPVIDNPDYDDDDDYTQWKRVKRLCMSHEVW